ncbi:acyltransferase family protein [Lysobacter humi (ex Lee et al. 2017)]
MTRTIDAAWSNGANHFNLIRLVAAWLVIYSHAWAITGTVGNDHVAWLTGFRSAGALAVDVFFLVSGFLVAASFERNGAKAFLVARVLRIFPALAVCVAATVLLGAALSADPGYWQDARTWRYLWSNVSLWRAEFWLPGVFEALPRTAVNGSLWTLPIEGRLYLALLLAGIAGMLRPTRYVSAWSIALIGAAAYAWRSAPLPEHIAYLLWVTAFFITGTLFWVLRTRIVLSGWATLILLAVAIILRGESSVGIAAYFALVAYGGLWLAFSARRNLLRHTDVSYGLYLYGWPSQQVALLLGATSVAANIAIASLIALACAFASWHLVERPALRLKNRFAVRLPAMEPA